MYVVNLESGMIHDEWCEYAEKIAPENRKEYEEVIFALRDGHAEARCCLLHNGVPWKVHKVRFD